MITISASLSATQLVASPTAQLSLTYSIADDNPYLTRAGAVVEWGDGTQDTAAWTAVPYPAVVLVHGYQPGVYVVKIRAYNYKSPTPDTAVYTAEIAVRSATPTPRGAPIVAGPILPRDQGFPSAASWSYNMGTDGVILESSLRMLLLTRKGERVYDPQYGTNLWRLVFNPNTDELPGEISNEISTAVAANEPRVDFVSASTRREGKVVRVQAEFTNKLTRQRFVLNVGFAQ